MGQAFNGERRRPCGPWGLRCFWKSLNEVPGCVLCVLIRLCYLLCLLVVIYINVWSLLGYCSSCAAALNLKESTMISRWKLAFRSMPLGNASLICFVELCWVFVFCKDRNPRLYCIFIFKASSVMPFLVLPKYVCHWLQQACRTLPSCEALRCEQYDDLQKRSVEAWLLVPQLQMSKTVNIREARCLM